MAENVTPNAKQRPPPMSSRLQSPTSPFFLGSNDDQLERAQARAARAAANRRKSTAHPPPQPSDRSDLFNKDQIAELFQNCIKLASENKINQKNTWDLTLIDHLSEIIRVESEDDAETNFQKASCTLEAGVKIYSLRVDSVHSEAYKVLGGINRVGHEGDKEDTVEGENIDSVQEEGRPKKESEKKISPLSTLESSFEALNVKKFDVAFTVDPLYHQSSAQFDEGGAKGLLLNNLGVYGGCRVLFDSLETPGKNLSCAPQTDLSEQIDISFAREYIEQMMIQMRQKKDISPSLRDIVNQFDEDNRRPPDVFSVDQTTVEQDASASYNQAEVENDVFDDCGPWGFDNDDQTSVHDDLSTSANPHFASNHEENGNYIFHEPDADVRFEKVAAFAFLGLGCISKQNSWAGPDHWKYRKAKGPEQDPVSASGSLATSKKSKNRKQAAIDIDFTKSLGKEMPDIFALPKNPKSLLLPASRVPCNTTLPEDCHYQPVDLVKLFLLPNVMCLGKRGRKSSDESRRESHTNEGFASWDNDSEISGHFDDGNVLSDMEDSSTLVSHPRQVNKIEVQYDKSSKQVDVHVLKETLWDHLQECIKNTEMGHEEEVSFNHVLSSFPADCAAAASKDISPHLCFICLLHLANEHGLSIHDCPTLDELHIRIPQHAKAFVQ
ncbi:condensin complex subunit 2 [Magnolia sinica]|uniref:condensin complex subunit 2 n=1 Tax=Magnolia sinica TaxID=86752 RepID=UPI00265A2A9D|nr:condensin complex subunit 2 [Magnolia sinica]